MSDVIPESQPRRRLVGMPSMVLLGALGGLLGASVAANYGLAGPFWLAGVVLIGTGTAFVPAMRRDDPTEIAEHR